jgi:plasmid stabilization system protein ParE
MVNTYKLIWSEEALENLKGIIEYLEKNWTTREIRKFAQLLDKNLNLIKVNPQTFPKSDHSIDFRRAVISKQVSIFYQIENQVVHVISVFDNRQNPNRLKKN